MNVLILTSWYPDKQSKIAGIFVKEQAKALKSIGLNPILFYPYDKSIQKGQLVEQFEDDIKVYRANTDYIKNTKLSRINSIIKTVKHLKKVVKDNNIELIHSHVCYPSGFAAAFFKKFYGTPYVITEHMSTIAQYTTRSYNRRLFDFAYSNAETVICVSSALRDELKALGFNFKDEVINNVVDTSQFCVKPKNRNKNEFNLLFIGQMDDSEVKGLNFFIPALSNFSKKHKEYKLNFTLISDGNKRKDYEKLCKDLNIEDICNFTGIIPKEEIPSYIEKSDLLVLPSIKETFGCVLVEAMACGKPVLTTKCGGPQDFVNEKVGVVVEPSSIKELENGLEKILENYDNFNADFVRDYAKDNFSYEAIGNKLKKLYSKIL